jgi:mono/diheme cytochrome c family protein
VREAPNTKEKIHFKMLEASQARGRVIYINNCVSCHGEVGRGTAEGRRLNRRPPDLNKLAKETANFTFFISISQWSGQMPGWKKEYSESDREDLVNYIKTLGKSEKSEINSSLAPKRPSP